MDIKTQLKLMLTLKHVSMKDLARLLSEQTGSEYTAAKLYGKINRDTITFTECQNIAKILGYKVEFTEID